MLQFLMSTSTECFRGFSNLRELEMPLNGLRGLNISFEDFPSLERLDLSYNNLSEDDILSLGVLPKLRVLHLSGNHLRSLPEDMLKPHRVPTSNSESSLVPRFALLEDLSLDDNQLSDLTTFASLAGLRRLKRLNLEKNLIQAVPHLKAVSGRHVAVEGRGSRSSGRAQRDKKKRATTPDRAVVSQAEALQAGGEEESLETDLSVTPEGGSLPPPFPELEYLNLANNEIAFEENLLAVAAWPMLMELDIRNNPLTVHNSGDPPLLKQYLVDRLGVHMKRKEAENDRKPTTVHVAPHRKIKEVARPLPKRPHPALLLAERPAILPSEHLSVQSHDPLPPISSTSDGPLGGEWEEDEKPSSSSPPPASKQPEGGQPDDGKSDDPVFLTQVDDCEDDIPEGPIERPADNPKKGSDEGYKELLATSDESDVYIHSDIQSNLRSLKLALQHKPVFRSGVDISRLQKPFNAHQKTAAETRPPHKTRDEELEEVFEAMKNRVTVTEENLGRILADKQRMRGEFPEVPKLLKEIQSKYKSVRAESMQEKRQLVETQAELIKTANEIKSHIPSKSST